MEAERRRKIVKDFWSWIDHRSKENAYQLRYAETHPWSKSLWCARQRCKNPHNNSYKYYGKKGIKCLITLRQVEEIWFRDKAYLLESPALDRINPKRNYTINNCRFIERSENTARIFRKKYKNRI